MKHTILLTIPLILLVSGCSSSPYDATWTHDGLDTNARQTEMARCDDLAAQAQDDYLESNKSPAMYTSGWINSDLSNRTKSSLVRDDAYSECMIAAGFAMQE